MRPFPEHERLNDQLEQHLASWSGKEPFDQSRQPVPPPGRQPPIDALVALASHLQTAPSLEVRPDFARQLEKRLLSHHVALRCRPSKGARQATRSRGSWFFARPLGAYISIAAVLLCSLVGTSMLALAAGVTNASHPLYPVKRWEQQIQLSLARSPLDQAQVSQQIVHDRLNTLANGHREAYIQALADLGSQLHALAQTLDALPPGQDRKRLVHACEALKMRARRVLRDGLPKLSLSERLLTTNELRHLGDPVTQLNSAVIMVSSPSPTQATISLAGNHLSAEGHVLIDQVLVEGSGWLENGMYLFVVNWNGQRSPQTIGILNADGTVAQTTIVRLSKAQDHKNSKNTQIGNNKGNISENTRTDHNSSEANENKPSGKSHPASPNNNGSNSHGHKSDEFHSSP
jgi:hypothetical protein